MHNKALRRPPMDSLGTPKDIPRCPHGPSGCPWNPQDSPSGSLDALSPGNMLKPIVFQYSSKRSWRPPRRPRRVPGHSYGSGISPGSPTNAQRPRATPGATQGLPGGAQKTPRTSQILPEGSPRSPRALHEPLGALPDAPRGPAQPPRHPKSLSRPPLRSRELLLQPWLTSNS